MTPPVSSANRVPVLRYADYMTPDADRPSGYQEFCGGCRRKLGGSYNSPLLGRPEYPEDLERKNSLPWGSRPLGWNDDRDYQRWAFCPWCGAEFEAEWWRNQPVQNERAIDHYQAPGSHKGDTHEFVGAIEGHVLGSSDPSYVCWCQPEVTPGLTGCVIRHTVLPMPEPTAVEVVEGD